MRLWPKKDTSSDERFTKLRDRFLTTRRQYPPGTVAKLKGTTRGVIIECVKMQPFSWDTLVHVVYESDDSIIRHMVLNPEVLELP